jgi:WD40 repeat protein
MTLILVSSALSAQMPAASSVTSDEYKLAWKLPVGDLRMAAVTPDGQRILLPVLFDGYYLYDSKGDLMWHLSDPNAVFAQLSSDGRLALMGTEYPALVDGQKVFLIDTGALKVQWNYTLDRIDHSSLSQNGERAAIVGADRISNGWQKQLVVKDQIGTVLLDQKFGGESDLASAPAISSGGRYVAVGTWSRSGRDQSLYFFDLDSGKNWNATVHEDIVYVAVSAKGTIVAAAGPQGLHVFDSTGNLLWFAPLPRLFEYAESYPHLWVSDSGEYIAVAGGLYDNAHVILFDVSGRELWDSQAPYSVQAFAVNNDGSRIAVGDLNGTIRVFDRSGDVLSRRDLRSAVRSIAIAQLGTMAAVGGDNVMYVLDGATNILWKHAEIGASLPFDVQISRDGKRIALGYSTAESLGISVINENGTVMITATASPVGMYGASSISGLSSDGRILVALNSTGAGTQEQSVLAWYDATTGREIRATQLDPGSVATSLSMSDNGSLVAVSGVVWNNYTFISAFDSQGRQLWKRVTNATELVGYYEFLHVQSSVAVSPDGLYVGAALREQSVRFGSVCGGRNGVVLYDMDGSEVWKHVASRCVWNVAVSKGGQFVLTGSDIQLDAFDHEGRILWNMSVSKPMVAISGSGDRFIAGSLNGVLLLGNASGPNWERDTSGSIESVAISDSGGVSAAIISSGAGSASHAFRLLQVLDSDGRSPGNYTYPRPAGATGGGHVAISGDACCIATALGSDGIYYFVRSHNHTEAATTTTSQNIPRSPDLRDSETVAAIIAVALGFSGLSLVLVRMRSLRRNRKTKSKVWCGKRDFNPNLPVHRGL